MPHLFCCHQLLQASVGHAHRLLQMCELEQPVPFLCVLACMQHCLDYRRHRSLSSNVSTLPPPMAASRCAPLPAAGAAHGEPPSYLQY